MSKRKKLSILDLDSGVFIGGWNYRHKLNLSSVAGASATLDKWIEQILRKTEADYYIGFCSKPKDNNNFRIPFSTIKTYKGNRKEEPWMTFFKPHLRKHMIKKWGIIPIGEFEADDAVTIAYNQFKDDYDVTMCFEDKDLIQMAALNEGDEIMKQYNFNRHHKGFYKWDKEGGLRAFYTQLITGDSSDNVPGIEGQGKKSNLLPALEKMSTEEEMFNHVRDAYIKKYGGRYMYYLLENYMLIKMLTEPCFDYPEDIEPIVFKGARPDRSPKTLVNL